MKCPCCNQEVETLAPEGAAKDLPPILSSVVRMLATRPGRFVPIREIAAIVFAGEPKKNTKAEIDSISNAIKYGRPKLNAMGFDIVGRRGNYGGRKLVARQNSEP